MRKLDATLNETNPDFFTKADAFFEYAKHDAQMVRSYFLVPGWSSAHIVTVSES
jgi:GH35 family endo-1,4-beta-xylanase